MATHTKSLIVGKLLGDQDTIRTQKKIIKRRTHSLIHLL